jgi:hypothetical protein
LKTTLGPALTDGLAPPNVSVIVGLYDAGVQAKHQLYVQGQLVLVSASDERIRRAIIRALGDLAAERPTGTVAVQAAVIITPDGRAMLVDHRLRNDLRKLDRRLWRGGLRVIDTATVIIEVATGAAMLSHPADVLGEGTTIARMLGTNDSDGLDNLQGGSIPISRLVFMGVADGNDLAQSLAEAAPMTSQPDHTLRVTDIECLLEVFRRIESRSAVPDDADALMAALGSPEL